MRLLDFSNNYLFLEMSDSEIQEEVDTFTFAGHDTTSSALTWILLMLANYPGKLFQVPLCVHLCISIMFAYAADWQEKVYQEQMEIFKDDPNAEVLKEHIGKMKHLEAIFKETMR